jgi:Winged helix-turn helix
MTLPDQKLALIQKFCALPGMRLPGDGRLTTASPGVGSRLPPATITRRGCDQCAPGRAVMLLLLHELPAAQIAELLECHPVTVRRWIGRFNGEGLAGLADRPRCGRLRLGGRRLAGTTARLLALPRRAVVLAEDETT